MSEPTFYPDAPCRSADHVDGRAMEVDWVHQFIGSSTMQSVSLVGEPGIGKTSLLAALGEPRVVAQHAGARAGRTTFVTVPLEAVDDPLTPAALWVTLGPLLAGVTDNAPLHSVEDFGRLPAVLDALDRYVVLFFDDFHKLTLSPEFDAPFFELLRSTISTCPRIACVTTSYLRLERLCGTLELAGSPFFNIFNILNIGCLEPPAAVTLLARRFRGDPVACQRIAERVAKAVGGHPTMLHRAGKLVEARGGSGLQGAALDGVLDEVYACNAPQYRRAIELASDKARAMVEAALAGRRLDEQDVDTLFLNTGLVQLTEGRPVFTSEHAERCALDVLGGPPPSSLWRRVKRLFG